MSKAEERSLEAYPVIMETLIPVDKENPEIKQDCNKFVRQAYIEGYHQAEKDLRNISWIKEISGVKEMSRAEEEALKAYPPRSIEANYDTINRRDAFEYGYLKAEKDLELTWEDMMLIHKCIKDAMNYHLYKMMEGVEGQKIVYQEVLKLFKEKKRN